MMSTTPGKIALLFARGALRAIELTLRAVAGALDSAPQRDSFGNSGDPLRGRVRTVSGTVEPTAYDENGQRVGANTRSPAVKDA